MSDYWHTNGEREILFRMGQAVIPPGKVFPPFTREPVLRGEVIAGSLPPAVRQAVRAIIWAIELGSIPRYRKRMSALDLDRRIEYLRTWSQGNAIRRAAFRYVTLPQKVFYYDDPDKFKALGIEYAKPPVQDDSPRWMSNVTAGKDIHDPLDLETEVVVVGTGAGGAAAACALAEQGDAVLMVEEGDYHRRSAFNGRPFEMQKLMYRGVGGISTTVGNTPILLPTGRCVGGTTTINSGTCFRTPERTLDRWRGQHGLTEYTLEAMEPYFARVEAEYRVERADMKVVGKLGEIMARGADRLGYSHRPLDRCAPDCDGQGVCTYGCPTGAKRSTDVSYVPRALRNNAQLLTGVRVEGLLVKNGRAVGVRGVSRATGVAVTIRARVVVLAMGTLMTPLFLRRQGVGNSSGRLGRNVSIHTAGGVVALMDEVVDGFKSIPQGYLVDQFAAQGL
ncbi:MAG: FAD-binding protein, partial [Deltaproteobacteria bacterium]|nr:FAD-binding protein [Deltaproteobacteria bacterium]